MYDIFTSASAATAVPECLVMSMSLNATRAAFRAPSITASGGPTKVYTVLFVEDPGSTSSKLQPSVAEMASAMASMTWILYILAKILSCNTKNGKPLYSTLTYYCMYALTK